MRKIIIDPTIFNKFPDFKRGLIIVSDIENKTESPAIRSILGAEMKKRAGTDCLTHEYVGAWDDAHRQFGSNPNKFPPSIKSLLKRIEKGGDLPFINSVVALFNYISIKYFLPCGGDDTATIKGDLCLGPAVGDETFTPLGGTESENPTAGEIIYFDSETKNIMCRRWNWRNGDFSKITPQSKKLVINIDGIGPVPETLVQSARDELFELLRKECGANLTTDLLNKNRQSINIDI